MDYHAFVDAVVKAVTEIYGRTETAPEIDARDTTRSIRYDKMAVFIRKIDATTASIAIEEATGRTASHTETIDDAGIQKAAHVIVRHLKGSD